MHVPPWLDDLRAQTVEIYANAIHSKCPCEWTEATVTPEHGKWKLVLRKRSCPIHGAGGHI
jgi:hypothetical protein